MANTMMFRTNFPVLYVPNLVNVPSRDLGRVYVFANGIPHSGPLPHGGGPLGFQEDVFNAIPGQDQYHQFKSPLVVKWKEGSNPRILTSVSEILQAQANGEITIQNTNIAVNMPIIVWQSQNGTKQVASDIEKIFFTMPDFKGELVKVDQGNFVATLKLHSMKSMTTR